MVVGSSPAGVTRLFIDNFQKLLFFESCLCFIGSYGVFNKVCGLLILNLLERTATTPQRQKGEDIADFVIRELKNKKQEKPQVQLSKEQNDFNKLAKINPNLGKFAKVFKLNFC